MIYWFREEELREKSFFFSDWQLSSYLASELNFLLSETNHLSPDSFRTELYRNLTTRDKVELLREYFEELYLIKKEIIQEWKKECFPLIQEAYECIFQYFDLNGFHVCVKSKVIDTPRNKQESFTSDDFIDWIRIDLISSHDEGDEYSGRSLHLVSLAYGNLHEIALEDLFFVEDLTEENDPLSIHMEITNLLGNLKRTWDLQGKTYWTTRIV